MKTAKEFLAALFAGVALITASEAAGAQQQGPEAPEKLSRYIEYSGFNDRVGFVEMFDYDKRQICQGFFDLKDLAGKLEARELGALQNPVFRAQDCHGFSEVEKYWKAEKIVGAFQQFAGQGKVVAQIDRDDIREKAMPLRDDPKAGRFVI